MKILSFSRPISLPKSGGNAYAGAVNEASQPLSFPRVSSRRKRRAAATNGERPEGGRPGTRGFRKARSGRERPPLAVNRRLRKHPRTCFEGPFGEVLRATGPMAATNLNPRGPTNHAYRSNSNLRFDPCYDFCFGLVSGIRGRCAGRLPEVSTNAKLPA